jgi:hypothetical protein
LPQTEAQNPAQQCSAPSAHQAARPLADTDLDRIIDAWPTLPAPIRADLRRFMKADSGFSHGPNCIRVS